MLDFAVVEPVTLVVPPAHVDGYRIDTVHASKSIVGIVNGTPRKYAQPSAPAAPEGSRVIAHVHVRRLQAVVVQRDIEEW